MDIQIFTNALVKDFALSLPEDQFEIRQKLPRVGRFHGPGATDRPSF